MSQKNTKVYQYASFFDLDKTLLTVNSSFYFGIFLFKQNYLPFKKLFFLLWSYFKHTQGSLSVMEIHQQSFTSLFQNNPSETFKALAAEFVNASFEKLINQKVVARLKDAQKEGHFVVILSSAPGFLVEPFAKRLSVDEWSASSYTSNKGVWSDINQIIQGEEKASYLLETCRKLGIPQVNSIAYSDSHLDLPFLRAAGSAVAVNPSGKLKKEALFEGWEVIRR